MTESRRRSEIPRRDFLKSAVAIGGAAALSACIAREGSPDVPTGDPAAVPDRQHEWDEYLSTDAHGNPVMARHHVLLTFDLPGETPDEASRSTVETALRSLERAYEWSNRGLLFTVGYSRRYFERFGGGLPDGVDLPRPEALAPFENPEADEPDVMLHLASDRAQVVLAAEEAMRGRTADLNGVAVEAALTDALTHVDRRTGFVGAGLPAQHQDAEGIPDGDHVDENAPLYMGFKSAYKNNQASEDRVTIGAGPFAGGTTQHVSKLSLNLNQWYEQDSRFQRVGKMYAPHHAKADLVEGVGDNLGTDSRVDEAGDPRETARRDGMVGHAQKMATAREDDEPVILRRDFDSTNGGASVHFVSVQESIGDFVATREAMNGTDLAAETAVGTRNNNGILQYVRADLRGNFLVPPRSLRALPPANP
jgi:deferrochelatase/peroxidase EfeB